MKMVFSVMKKTGIGMMSRTNAIELTQHEPRDGEKYPYQSAKIHFDFLFTRGDAREANIQIMNHILNGGDDAHFQVIYQIARFNEKTGKQDPDRFWKVKAWRDEMRSPSPSDAPAIKITLHGGSVGPKDAVSIGSKLSAAKKDAKKNRKTADADGFVQPKMRGALSVPTASDDVGSLQTLGGVFAALATPSESSGADSPDPPKMTKTAIKNAKRRASKARNASSAQHLSGGVVGVVHDAINNHLQTQFTDEELYECDNATDNVQHSPTNEEIIAAAGEFLAENQLAQDGDENCQQWQMDASTGSMIFHNEMTIGDANLLVRPHQVLDDAHLGNAINIAESGN